MFQPYICRTYHYLNNAFYRNEFASYCYPFK
nr:MAG TPA: hypothetical protein [Caudoviricetes sp.]